MVKTHAIRALLAPGRDDAGVYPPKNRAAHVFHAALGIVPESCLDADEVAADAVSPDLGLPSHRLWHRHSAHSDA